VAALAHHFNVSYQAAVYRLSDVGLVSFAERQSLLAKTESGRKYLDLLHRDDSPRQDRELVSRVVRLAIEAYRRGEIPKSRLREVSRKTGTISSKELIELVEAAGGE
jgi:Zn-dependent peptidase ImmA (M78 family)